MLVATVRMLVVVTSRLGSVGLACRIGLSAEVGGGRADVGEVAREDGLEEGSEDDLGAAVIYIRASFELLVSCEHTRSGEEPSREQGRT
jgi:hypothetical protein